MMLRLRSYFDRSSIRSQLFQLVLAISTVVMTLSLTGVILLEWKNQQAQAKQALANIAQATSVATSAAVAFQDGKAADEALRVLIGHKEIQAAALYPVEGKLLARYGDPARLPPNARQLQEHLPDTSLFSTTTTLFLPILLDGSPIGHIFIRANLHEYRNEFLLQAALASGINLLGLLLALGFGLRFLDRIIKPVKALAETSRRVREGKDYSLRATPPMATGHEVDDLIVSFNAMLTEIEQRDSVLAQYQQNLERRVLERTEQLADREMELRTLIESEPECIKRLAADGSLLYINRAGLDMIEADTLDQALGQKMQELVMPAQRNAFMALLQDVYAGRSGNLIFEIQGLKGGLCWMETHAVPLRNAQGDITSLLGLSRNITQRRQAEAELRIAAVSFETESGIMITDHRSVILRVNPAFTRLTGYSAQEAIGQTPSFLNSGHQDPKFYQHLWASLKDKGYWQGEVWNKRKDGVIYAEMLNITGVTSPGGEITHYVGSFTDITESKAAEAEIHRLAYYDVLTKLPNRRLLQDRLHLAIANSARSGRYGAIYFIDLDHFKVLNDTRGHDVGDLLLTAVAQRLRAVMREGDTVARLGGDEFVVLMGDLNEEINVAAAQAQHQGEKLQSAMETPFALQGYDYHCNLSIGVSLFDRHDTAESLLKKADLALYKAKNDGRNTLSFFDPAMQVTLDLRSALEAELRQALNRGQFCLCYQPQVDSAHRLTGVEALLRWQHPERGPLLPDVFIPLAEDTGLILSIGLWVLETACAQIKTWDEDALTRKLEISVNVSVRQFRQPDFVAQIARALESSGATPACLKLELTESLVLQDVADTIEKMHAIRKLGVKFSLDDFGTGYSSLSYLAQLPLDQLKIDKSFVLNLPGKTNDATIARAIITMAREMGMNVIAEGVETEAQRDFLKAHGCDTYQGYLFSQPLPIKAFEEFLLSNRST